MRMRARPPRAHPFRDRMLGRGKDSALPRYRAHEFQEAEPCTAQELCDNGSQEIIAAGAPETFALARPLVEAEPDIEILIAPAQLRLRHDNPEEPGVRNSAKGLPAVVILAGQDTCDPTAVGEPRGIGFAEEVIGHTRDEGAHDRLGQAADELRRVEFVELRLDAHGKPVVQHGDAERLTAQSVEFLRPHEAVEH